MNVSAIIQQKGTAVFTTTGDTLVLDCVKLMNEKKIGALVVVDEAGVLAGIITERDILRTLDMQDQSIIGTTAKQIMTPKDRLIVTTGNAPIELVMDQMTRYKIRHLPVLENEKLVGIISIGDIVKNRLDQTIVENESMKNYISGT